MEAVDKILILAGVILSLGMSYLPKIKDWYDKKSPEEKQLIMAGLILGATVIKFSLGCLGKDTDFACNWDGGYNAVVAFFIALAVNAGVYQGTKKITDSIKARWATFKARRAARRR